MKKCTEMYKIFGPTEAFRPLCYFKVNEGVNRSFIYCGEVERAVVRSFPNLGFYCMSKAAVDMFTRCLALELAEDEIRVNAVNPDLQKRHRS